MSTAAFYGRWETEEAAKHMRELPIDCVEVFLQSESEYSPDFAKLIKENLGLIPCTSVHPLGHHENFMAQRPERQKKDAFDTLQRILDAGQILGAQTYVYHGRHTPQLSPLKWNMQWNCEALEIMCAQAERRGMVIGWENVFWCQLTEPSRVLEAKRALPQVRFTLDIKQAMRAGCDPIEFVYAMGDHLSNVHVCDWDEEGNLCLPGEGVFDFSCLFSALKEVEYSGPVILEPYLRIIRDDDALHSSLTYLKGYMNERRNPY